MTPAEHIQAAEQAIADAEHARSGGWDDTAQIELSTGILHALIAIAVESGVPHQTPASEVS